MVKKLVIDTDGAIDDIRAISLALQTADVEVIFLLVFFFVCGEKCLVNVRNNETKMVLNCG